MNFGEGCTPAEISSEALIVIGVIGIIFFIILGVIGLIIFIKSKL